MAHWGIAMSYYHPLWQPPLDPAFEAKGRDQITQAAEIKSGSAREAGFISALTTLYSDTDSVPLRDRMKKYEEAMGNVAEQNPADIESQIFYALALLSVAPPTDQAHAYQKKAVAILEPLYAKYPQHPGIAHYLIHACDNTEMAAQGLKPARDYSQIAPSAPHALHMPSHIFTRLGMWNDSVQSNLAARKAAHDQGDIGEELHAMDYLAYAYLQLGRDYEVGQLLNDLSKMTSLPAQDFKVSYAASAMPVRYAVERGRWSAAAKIQPMDGAPPQVVAVSVWATALACAHLNNISCAKAGVRTLYGIERKLQTAGDGYWSKVVGIYAMEVTAWLALAERDPNSPTVFMRGAADIEDALEKLPVTPGPVLPAREQLGELWLAMNEPVNALKEFEVALKLSPGRRNSIVGALKAAQLSGQSDKVATYQAALKAISPGSPQ